MKKYINNNGDFGKWFYQNNLDKIIYRTRNDSNYYHDLFYISSYIHDSEFDLSRIKQTKTKLCIELDRIRWELFKDGDDELISIKSQLVINNVIGYSLQLSKYITNYLKDSKVEVQKIYHDIANNNLILFNKTSGFKLTIRIKNEQTPLVFLEDIGTFDRVLERGQPLFFYLIICIFLILVVFYIPILNDVFQSHTNSASPLFFVLKNADIVVPQSVVADNKKL